MPSFIYNFLSLSFVFVPLVMWSVLVFFGVRKYVHRHDSSIWNRIKSVFLLGYSLLVWLSIKIGKALFQMSSLEGVSSPVEHHFLMNALIMMVVSVLMVCAGLWYKNALTVKNVGVFIVGYMVGLAGLAILTSLLPYFYKAIFL